jgi:hypothetical protein
VPISLFDQPAPAQAGAKPAPNSLAARLLKAEATYRRLLHDAMMCDARKRLRERTAQEQAIWRRVGRYLLAERRKRSRADWAAWLESYMLTHQPRLGRRKVSFLMRRAANAERIARGEPIIKGKAPW